MGTVLEENSYDGEGREGGRGGVGTEGSCLYGRSVGEVINQEALAMFSWESTVKKIDGPLIGDD